MLLLMLLPNEWTPIIFGVHWARAQLFIEKKEFIALHIKTGSGKCDAGNMKVFMLERNVYAKYYETKDVCIEQFEIVKER
jgi:hypothetical protein